jgi:hypothetical protein
MGTGRRRRPTFLLLVGLISAGSLVAVSGVTATSSAPRAVIVPPALLALRPWISATANLAPVQGTVELNGRPVAGVHVRVDGYTIPAATKANGKFTYLVDDTLLERHLITIADATDADSGSSPLTSAERSALAAAGSAITVAYPVSKLKVSRNSEGEPVVTGQIVDTAGDAPPKVDLSTYSLSGTVTDSNGKPVAGALVSTQTSDRDYWTVSTATDAKGHFTSLFTASDESSDNPVPFTVRIAVGNDIYQFLPDEYVYFRRLESATLNLQLPPAGFPMALPLAQSRPGAIYLGTVVGATESGHVVRPVAATWTDAKGDFSMTLPRALAGKTVSLWEGTLDLFSVKPARPGGPVDLRDWPSTLPANVPRDLLSVRLP